MDNFLKFAQNIHCGYMLEPNEYPQYMFKSKNKEIMYSPVNPQFYYIKVVYKGV